MNNELETALAQLEETKLSKVRNVGLDLVATIHLIESHESKREWTCHCSACEYLRNSPRVLESVQKAIYKRQQEGLGFF